MEEIEEKVLNGQHNIDIDSDVSNGIFSNFPIVASSEYEVVIDFASILPGFPNPKVQSRVILPHKIAKNLLKNLKHHLDKISENEENEKKDPEVDFFVLGGSGQGNA